MNTNQHSRERGTFTVSIDLELAWGDKGKERYLLMHEREREAIVSFIKLCEEFDIPCTWATVGNLFLRDRGDAKQRNVELIGRGALGYGSLIQNENEHLWFGADIVESIIASRVKHEIGCHTFFHTLVSETDEASYERELRQCIRIARETFGIELTSFVYPRNEGGYQGALTRAGFASFRANDACTSNPSFLPRRVRNFYDEFTGQPVQSVVPVQLENGLWALPGSYFFPKVLRGGVRAPMWARIHKCTHGIARAEESGENIHLWFHPHNIALEPKYWVNGFRQLFAYVRGEREKGRLRTVTMKELVS